MSHEDDARAAIAGQKPLSEFTDADKLEAMMLYGPCWCGEPMTSWLSEPETGDFLFSSICLNGHVPDGCYTDTPSS